MLRIKKYERINKIKQSYCESLPQVRAGSNNIREAICFTVDNLFDPALSVRYIKDKCYISGKSFATKFSIETGYTPKSFILYHRIEVSKLLLKQVTVPITVIAISIGFSSLAAFDNAFRRQEGYRPSVWVEKIMPKNKVQM